MSNGETTLVVIAGLATLGFLGYEGYALATGHTTISEYVWRASARYPLIPYLFGLINGLLAGHFFWQRVS